MGKLRIVEAAVDELPVVLFLHFPKKVSSVLRPENALFFEVVVIRGAVLQGTGHIEHCKVVVAAEHIEHDQMLFELELRLEAIVPGELETVHHPPTLAVPVKSIQQH